MTFHLFNQDVGRIVFEDWSTVVQCNNCGTDLELPKTATEIKHGDLENFKCPKCSKSYVLKPNGISYAYAESMGLNFYRHAAGSQVEVRYFENPPMAIFEEAWQDFSDRRIGPGETRPTALLPIVKKYHDAIKMRLRRLLVVNPGDLTSKEITEIKEGPLGVKLNIVTLFEYLKKAYVTRAADIDAIFSKNEKLIREVLWIRNKLEHILFDQWPLGARIYTDIKKSPSDTDGSYDTLNFDFVRRVNVLAVDIFSLAESIFPTDPEYYYLDLEQYRHRAQVWIEFE